ncbi:hypothetical protein [Exiguobacterium acetylicum]|uniref:hypothetical protein n=1 Tax=Exiguobacterium acetylicum TaxID=41170 RepID=UPI000681226B|nr:hypothetical protein [Exiguobacterium acetylicum]KNH34929.1 hypothetical protein ACS74_08840 [Exiguobacterium acetylicum]
MDKSYFEGYEALIADVYRSFTRQFHALPTHRRTKRQLRNLAFSVIRQARPTYEERTVLYAYFAEFFRAVEEGQDEEIAFYKQIAQ